jgi:hypothetical protein
MRLRFFKKNFPTLKRYAQKKPALPPTVPVTLSGAEVIIGDKAGFGMVTNSILFLFLHLPHFGLLYGLTRAVLGRGCKSLCLGQGTKTRVTERYENLFLVGGRVTSTITKQI